MTVEKRISEHYATQHLLEIIVEALGEMGIAPADVTPEDLAPVDEFHVGGVAATEALIQQLALSPDMRVLDIGSGIGGTSRFIARKTGTHVTGIDLTPEYCATASALSEMVGLSGLTSFQTASAAALPFEDDSFDAALMLHVGMNIADKSVLMSQVARILKPGSTFAIYDLMKRGPSPPKFPVPWASEAEQSFLADISEYRHAAVSAGFEELSCIDRSERALQFFTEQKARIENDGTPKLGLHILMGDSYSLKIGHMVDAIAARSIAPTELKLRLP